MEAGFGTATWGLLREARRAKRLLAARKGAILVKAGILEELGSSLRDEVHFHCMYLVIGTVLADTVRWAGKGAEPNVACIGIIADLSRAKGATVEHRRLDGGCGRGRGRGQGRGRRAPAEWGYADERGIWSWQSAIGSGSRKLFLDYGFYVVDTYEDVLGLDICDGR